MEKGPASVNGLPRMTRQLKTKNSTQTNSPPMAPARHSPSPPRGQQTESIAPAHHSSAQRAGGADDPIPLHPPSPRRSWRRQRHSSAQRVDCGQTAPAGHLLQGAQMEPMVPFPLHSGAHGALAPFSPIAQMAPARYSSLGALMARMEPFPLSMQQHHEPHVLLPPLPQKHPHAPSPEDRRWLPHAISEAAL